MILALKKRRRLIRPKLKTKASTIPIRHADFSFDGSKMSKYCWDDNAFSSAFILTFSALIPHGEKFVIESMRDYRNQITDPALKSQITSLIGQEAMHSKVHEEFNRIYQEKGLPVDKISKVGEWYFEKHLPAILPKSARLAVTCAIEHFTAMMAERSFTEIEKINNLDVGAREFLTWHLIEEAEHKAVAFDVYTDAVNSYGLRVFALLFITAYTSTLFAWSIQEIMRTPGYSKGAKKDFQGFLYWFGIKGYFPTLQNRLKQYMHRGFHPNQIDTETILNEWGEKLFGQNGELTPFIEKTILPRNNLSKTSQG